jgi:hypothetical protein
MNMKNKRILIGLVLIVAIAVVFGFLKKKEIKAPDTQTIKSGTELTNDSNEQAPKTSAPELKGNSLTGTLQKSDNAKNGNLMVITEGRKHYIRTSRDYISLIGKQVDVRYEGTLEDFVLGDIVEHK